MSDDLITMHEGRDVLGQSIYFQPTAVHSIHVYELRPRKNHRGVDPISDVLPFGRLWYDGPDAAANAIGYATHRSRSHDAVIRVYDATGNVIETHEHAREFKEW